MLKYVDTMVTFAEVPDEISLCINISNCPCHCVNCHSPWLSEDIGKDLTQETLLNLINKNDGITCVCFMGGDALPNAVHDLAKFVRENTDLKTAWYSGKEELPFESEYFDYVKLGPYIEEKGPLTSRTTNQRMLRYYRRYPNYELNAIDITKRFWK